MADSTTQANARLIAAAIQRAGQIGKQQRVFVGGKSQAGADAASSTDTVNYVTAEVWVWDELPDGLYVVVGIYGLTAGHSTSGVVSFKPELDQASVQPTAYGITTQVTTRTFRWVQVETFLDVEASGGTGLTFRIKYLPQAAGTASAVNPFIAATAVLVG
jgi:hypothetical protein